MALTKMNDDLDIIQKLDDEPNDVGGMSAEELKKKFDEAPNAIKEYINGLLIPGIEAAVEQLEKNKAGRDELQGVVLNQIPDGTVTAAKLAAGAVTKEKLSEGVQQEIAEHVRREEYSAAQLPVSDGLAESVGLAGPAFTESVLAMMAGKLNGLLDSAEGVPTGNSWNMYRWAAFGENTSLEAQGEANATFYIRVANDITFEENGAVGLVSPVLTGAADALPGVGVYFQAQTAAGWGDVYRVQPASTNELRHLTDGANSWVVRTWRNVAKQVPYTEYLGKVTAENGGAYPEDGWVGGIHYVKEVTPDSKVARLQTVARHGTGGHGASSPTKFAFDFAPAMVLVFDGGAGMLLPVSIYYNTDKVWAMCPKALGTEYEEIAAGSSGTASAKWYAKRSADGKTVELYATGSAADQLNEANVLYYAIAIG